MCQLDSVWYPGIWPKTNLGFPVNAFLRWVCACMLSCLSHIQLFVTPWTVAHQAPLSMWFSRQGCWSGLPGPPPVDLPKLGSNLHLLQLLHCRKILYHWTTREAPLIMRLSVKSVDWVKQMGLIQSVESLNMKELTFIEEEGILPASSLWTWMQLFLFCRFWLNKFRKKEKCFSTHTHTPCSF